MENAAERARKALDSLVYLPSLKGHGSISSSLSSPPGPGQGHHPCRTWDRGDLLRRLHSFKSSTWFCKPHGAGPMECARRGWVNHSMDMLSCEFCGARLSLPLPTTLPPEEVTKIGREFSERLASAHDTGCPWGTSACDPSLAQFPPLDRSVVAADFAAREKAVGRLNVLPPIAEDAYARINAVRRSRLQQLLVHGPQRAAPRLQLTMSERLPESPAAGATMHSNGGFRGCDLIRQPQELNSNDTRKGSEQPAPGIACQGTPEFTRRQRFLALCGWDVLAIRPDAAARSRNTPTNAASRNSGGFGRGGGCGGDGALDATGIALGCEMCGARAGLWDFVPRMVPPARPGASLVTTGLKSRDHAPRAATRMTDLSRTIAGGSLSPDQAPPISPQGPFGASSTIPLSFGARTPATPAQSPGPSGKGIHGTSPRSGTIELSTPGGVFGSPSAALPSFGTPASSPAPSTPAVTAPHPFLSTPLGASIHPFSCQPTAASTAMPSPGPFGSSAAPHSPVFGLAAMAATEGTRSPAAPSKEESLSAAIAPAAGGTGRGPFGGKTGPPQPVFGLAALQARATAVITSSSAVASTPPPVTKHSLDHFDDAHAADPPPPSSKRPRLSQAVQQQQQQQQQSSSDSSFEFPVLPAAADLAAPKPMAFPASAMPAGVPAVAAAASRKPVTDPFSPRTAQQLQPFDPLLFHRTFCPWVNTGSNTSSSPGGKPGRCGWRWCLDALIPESGPEEVRDTTAADDPRSKVAAILRKLRAP